MKTYKERTDIILEKVTAKRNKQRTLRASIGAGISTCAAALALFLFVPFDSNLPSIEKYQGNEYYAIIEKLNVATYHEPIYDNYFDMIVGEISQNVSDGIWSKDDMMSGSAAPEGGSLAESAGENYVETTDNQVSGVIEGDRIKRSSSYIYYMNDTALSIYTIEGENSKLIKNYIIEDKDGYKLSAYADEWEMFLSKDCSTITILSSCFHSDTGKKYVCLINLDVTNPENITETGRNYLSGSYLSSRLVDDEILLISHFNVDATPDFTDESTFVPQYGTPENMTSVPADNIIAPDELDSTLYTTVCKIDAKTLEARSTAAFLSYADEVYVSSDNIFASRRYQKEEQRDGYTYCSTMSEISAMSYSGDTLEHIGSFDVAGTILNQYSMDEYEGILRVAATTNDFAYRETTDGENAFVQYDVNTEKNASLYCVDLSTWQIVASVEHFAPANEEIRSVRFDKNLAYICTAVVLSDPVYVFDLSDLNNITSKDSGTITGYSSSLINFGNGYLLGVGYGSDFSTFKLEIYKETADGVASVCSYEVSNCNFATEYKSYFIDREKQFIGLGYSSYSDSDFTEHYSLFGFDGYDFVKIIDEEITGNNNYKRAILIDGYLYMFGKEFVVRNVLR